MKTSVSGVYRIRNIETGDSYIGSTIDIESRLVDHRWYLERDRHINARLQNAWNKYGSNAFVFEVVTEVKRSMLLIVEQEYIDREWGTLYNLARHAGAPMRDRQHSDKTRQQMSVDRRGRTKSPETRQRMTESHKKFPRIVSDETRRRMSESAKTRAARDGRTGTQGERFGHEN